ncbi:two-component system sensor histidine kinase DesK [Actinoplanes lutulentus]|uniref:Two-component system sensor histidine kinase DesK n=1 Tax=Actinoplanes lutulentus TaxID=1287878 RepID=A0A327Z4N7_9ACTN|nr:histidine kinase [Actinoplanes lutulentus]MBB2948220.1 two-component system sensor histidine kinase DesK [Actinoplanes lutulentus]RAK31281.1 two-component system sensor histidine kinase DesK [Actinoplanes lutulentus]
MVDERPAPRYGWAFAAIWLFYLGENLNALVRTPPGWQRSVGLTALAGFAVVYVLVLARVRHFQGLTHSSPAVSPGRRAWWNPFAGWFTPGDEAAFAGGADRRERLVIWVALALMTGLGALQIPGAGPHALTCLVYIAATAMMGLPRRQGISVAVTLVVLAEVLLRTLPSWKTAGHGYSLAIVLAAIATGGIRLALDRQRRLQEAHHEIAALAVADERARIAAELHDILGHSLTVVTVKAELAQRLLDVDLDRARAELRDLESLARDALADVRATALGMRGISLPGEIAAARQALAAANVEADLPGAADDVPTRNRELFAWTIREAVTNIVRHSGARHASVRLTPHQVEIVDDGSGFGGPVGAGEQGGGQGLAGLRRRAEELGARFTAGDRENASGFRVLMEAPS